MKPNLFNFFKLFIGWPVSLISLYFILKIVFAKAQGILHLNQINFFTILISMVCFSAYFFIRGYVWREILKNKNYKLNFKNSLYSWSTSELKRYTPGNIWSFIGRTLAFENMGVKKEDSAKSLFYEAEFFLVGAAMASVFAIGFVFDHLPSLPFELIVQPIIFIMIGITTTSFIYSKNLRKKIFVFSIFPPFKSTQNLKIVIFSFLAVLFFGFGSYFATASIFYINPQNFIILSSFFSLSLLIGYLSLITPTGLGVREGVMTWGLSHILPIEASAISSIFSRIIFIVTELLFLLFIWVWKNFKGNLIKKVEDFIGKNKHELILVFFMILYIIYFAYASFLRYDNFFTGRFDLGNMDQTIWNTIHGRIFQLTDPNGTNITSRLSFHADFILILISPLYWIWSNPKILLLFQSIFAALGAFFIYLITKNVLKNKNFSLLFAFIFLLSPAIEYPNLYDFHPAVLATTFLLGSFYFILRKKYIFVIIFLLLAGVCKEDIWIINSLFGLYIFFINKKKLLGLEIFILSLSLFYFLVWIAIPNALGGQHFALSYYSDFGTSPNTIVKNILFNPLKIINTIVHKSQLQYLLELFFPLAFLSLLSPLYLIFIMPNLLINLLSNNTQLHQIYFQYSAEIIPFIFISSIFAVKKLLHHFPKIPLLVYGCLILITTVYSAYAFGPLPFAKNPNVDMFTKTLPNRMLIGRYLGRIPKNYSVSSTNNLGSHLSRRQLIYTVPVGIDKADIVAFLIRDYLNDPQTKLERQILLKVEKDINYQLIFKDGDFIVFKRRALL